jgi:hypothetical protein
MNQRDVVVYPCLYRGCKRELTGPPWEPRFCSREHAAAAQENVIIRVERNARELAGLFKREGLRFGTMPPEEAVEYLQDTERRIAEVRGLLGPARSALDLPAR